MRKDIFDFFVLSMIKMSDLSLYGLKNSFLHMWLHINLLEDGFA